MGARTSMPWNHRTQVGSLLSALCLNSFILILFLQLNSCAAMLIVGNKIVLFLVVHQFLFKLIEGLRRCYYAISVLQSSVLPAGFRSFVQLAQGTKSCTLVLLSVI